MDQHNFLVAQQPPESPMADRPESEEMQPESGTLLFETAVAIKGGICSIRLVDTPAGPVLELQAAGGLRKPAPMKLDPYQAQAFRIAVMGAVAKVDA